jgi:acetylornithine deacetylase/succinyl-diaminopimelate desuccinylase-like protein
MPTDIDAQLSAVLTRCERDQERNLADLFTLLRQPSISAQNVGVRECAELERQFVRDAGATVHWLETPTHPLIVAEFPGPSGAPTLLFYGHYDVQPPEPLDAWETPPFEPVIRNDRIYARGVADNKAQHFAHIAALRAWREETGRWPVSVKLILDGEEEIGSPNFEAVLAEHRDLLAANLVVSADGATLRHDRPSISYGLRGIVSFELHVRGASSDLHSGNWGGVAPNAAWRLVHVLATMLGPDNVPLIDGFMDDVAPLSRAAREAIDRVPIDVSEVLRGIGIDRLPQPDDLPYLDRIMARPTITINGLTSGYQGQDGKTVIPSEASAKIDMRLVPNQDPHKILALVEAHLRRVAPDVEFIPSGGITRPSSTPLDHPLAEPVRRAVRTGFGAEPIELPLVGASSPDAVFTRDLGLASFHVPYGVPDQRNHGPNENMPVARFYTGIRTSAALLAELAK